MQNSNTKLIAHRGCSIAAPENTIVAFQKAIDCGVNYLELDVRKTKDGVLVVIHDPTIDRVSSNGEKGKIDDFTLHELSQISVGNPLMFGHTFLNQNIPTLQEVLQLAKGKIKVAIEIKIDGIEEALLKLIDEQDMINDTILISFRFPVLAKIRQLNHSIPIQLIRTCADELTIDYATLINCNGVCAGNATNLNSEFLSFAHKHNLEVWAWTIDNEQEMKRLIDIGVDGLISNIPEKAIPLLS